MKSYMERKEKEKSQPANDLEKKGRKSVRKT